MKTRILQVAVLAAVLLPVARTAAAGIDFQSWREPYGDKLANQYVSYAADLERVGAHAKAGRIYGLAVKHSESPSLAGYATLCRADTLYRGGKRFKALRFYKQAIETYPQYIDYAHALTMLRVIAEDFAGGKTGFWIVKGAYRENAREVYRYLTDLAPYAEETAGDMMRLAELYRDAGQPEAAMELYKSVLERFRTSPAATRARVELAETLIGEAGKTRDKLRLAKSAELYAERALREDPENADAQQVMSTIRDVFAGYYLGLGHFYLKPASRKPEEARRYFQLVVSTYGGTEAAAEAAAELARLTGSPGHAAPGGEVSSPDSEEEPHEQANEERPRRRWWWPLSKLGF